MKSHPDPAAYKLRHVHAGDEYSRSVEGGFRRARAPEDGLVVDQEDRTIFIPLAEVMAAVAKLTPRAGPRRNTLPGTPPAPQVLPGDDRDK